MHTGFGYILGNSTTPPRYVGETCSPEKCTELVQRTDTGATGATWSIDNIANWLAGQRNDCYAVYGAKEISRTDNYKFCLFKGI